MLTFLVSITNLILVIYNNKRNIYANTVLKERLESLTALKENSSELIGVLFLCVVNRDKFLDNYMKIIKYINLVSYQFNISSIEEAKKVEALKYISKLIYIEVSLKDIKDIESFCIDNDLYFFSKIDFKLYDYNRFQRLLLEKIKESIIDFENDISIHLKLEWEKIKKN